MSCDRARIRPRAAAADRHHQSRSRRPVFWNIGAIAASGHPEALALFRRHPARLGLHPRRLPAGAGRCRERWAAPSGNARGWRGLAAGVPLSAVARHARVRPARPRERNAWVVRNGRLDTEWSSTNRSHPVASPARAASTLLHFSARRTTSSASTSRRCATACGSAWPISAPISRRRATSPSRPPTCARCSPMPRRRAGRAGAGSTRCGRSGRSIPRAAR